MMESKNFIFEKIKNERPPVHTTPKGEFRCVGLGTESLEFIFNNMQPGSVTLETGCGLSTLVFGLTGCHHTAIVPNKSHIQETIKSAEKLGVSLDYVTFIPQRSETYLPTLSSAQKLDAILIDGGHAFPIPMIDWYYTQKQLKESGILIVDDVHLKTVSILYEFLKRQPEWQEIRQHQKTVFFQKNEESGHDNEWDFWRSQPYNTNFRAKFSQLLTSIKARLKN